jgi:hypothetical protein
MRIRKLLVAGVVTAAVVGLPAAAMADPYPPKDTSVLGTDLARSNAAPTPAAVIGTSAGRAGLPVTGGDIAGLTGIGLAAIGTGTVLVRRSRRNHKTA